MCTVSMVMDDWTKPGSPNYIPWLPLPKMTPPLNTQDLKPFIPERPDKELANLMKKAIELLEKIDQKLDRGPCKVDAEHKKKIMEEIEKHLS